MKQKLSNFLHCLCFLIILCAVLLLLRRAANSSETLSYRNLYKTQAKDSVDIVFVGNSSTYMYYDVMAVWEKYGITSLAYASLGMPFEFTVSMLELVQENQSPEVYVIDLRIILTDEYNLKYYGTSATRVHKENYANALKLLSDTSLHTNALLAVDWFEGESYLYILDLLYTHTALSNELKTFIRSPGTYDIFQGTALYKGNAAIRFYVNDLTKSYVDLDDVPIKEGYILSDETTARMVELFEYCNEQDLNVYFTFTPYLNARNTYDQEIRAALSELTAEYGYPLGDYRDEIEEIGLDFAQDYYDVSHANALGAKKYTLYAMEDILEAYPITPEYDDAVIEDWDAAYADWCVYFEENVASITQNVIGDSTLMDDSNT